MDIFDQILENLELERDLGTRTVEIDRALLVPPSAAPTTPPPPPKPASVPVQKVRVAEPPSVHGAVAASEPAFVSKSPAAEPVVQCDIAFFTGRPLSAKGAEAMEKIFGAIKKIRQDITISLNEERKAKVCVLLGSDALLKRLPTSRPVRGAWVTVADTPAIMTFSPDYIFSHFQENSPNMNRAKLEMWNDIKLAVARL